MVQSLVSLCAREVVSDHSSSPYWLKWVPRELFGPLLDAAFSSCRPLAVGELAQRWPERTLRVGGRRKQGLSLTALRLPGQLRVLLRYGLKPRYATLCLSLW
uniref:Uncharacterized protein n=1 Tax=Mastacembelus armatus TaxID=205130 RepID=A0A7N8Y0M2_9TELE